MSLTLKHRRTCNDSILSFHVVHLGAKVQRKDATWPTFQSLSLPGQPGISLIGTCCRQVSYPSPREALATSALVIQSDLQAAFIEQNGQLVTWVTTTQGQSKAKEGARVQVYGSTYGKVRGVLLLV